MASEEKKVEEVKPTEAPKVEEPTVAPTQKPEVKPPGEQKGAWQKTTEEKPKDIKSQIKEAKKEGVKGWQIALVFVIVIVFSAGLILLYNKDLRNQVKDFFDKRLKRQ